MNYKIFFQKSNNIAAALILISALLPIIAQADLIPCGNGDVMCTLEDLIYLADNVINFILFDLAAPLAVLSIAIGGVLMITASGDTGQLERGKSIFYNTVIGFVVAFGAWLIVQAILTALVPSGSTAFTKLKDYINL
ncbi:MAG: hypothetical protein HZA37_00780 [Parcubacteria group bacterium]|nr:hypothetical protein [Parcubacteria group bacterium]